MNWLATRGPVLLMPGVLLSGCGNIEGGNWGVSTLVGALLFFFTVVIDIVALSDLWRSPRADNEKLLWGVLIVLLPILGAVLYFLLGRNTTRRWS